MKLNEIRLRITQSICILIGPNGQTISFEHKNYMVSIAIFNLFLCNSIDEKNGFQLRGESIFL